MVCRNYRVSPRVVDESSLREQEGRGPVLPREVSGYQEPVFVGRPFVPPRYTFVSSGGYGGSGRAYDKLDLGRMPYDNGGEGSGSGGVFGDTVPMAISN